MKALLVYKKSTYDMYVTKNSDVDLSSNDKAELLKSHEANAVSIKAVEDALRILGIDYEKTYRAALWDGKDTFGTPDLIIAVGGDGTFIEASRIAHGDQIMLGINSDPKKSFGHYCCADKGDALEVIRAVKEGTADIDVRWRIKFDIDGFVHNVPVMNDLLIHHPSPAGLTRYIIHTPNMDRQEHYCSGLWVSTPCGQSGALSSFDGPVTYEDSRSVLFQSCGFIKSKINSDTVLSGVEDSIYVRSRMRDGKIYVDGQHVVLDFPYNSTLSIFPNDGVRIVQGFSYE
jgi:NAD+ kinase